MNLRLSHQGQDYQCDLSQPIDISIPVGQVRCFYADEFVARPYVAGDFVGSVKAGSPVNFFELQLNPHGHGTHTECFGHITSQQEHINDQLTQYHFLAQLISLSFSQQANGDQIISKEGLEAASKDSLPEALIIRTRPNSETKLTKDYSGTNPPYLEPAAMEYLVQQGVKHLLIDLPSVDREDDGGQVLGHRIFWKVVKQAADADTRTDCTITELIFVPDDIPDGLYLLNLQLPSIPLDAVPSKPILYTLSILE